jgi:hypothetical protein
MATPNQLVCAQMMVQLVALFTIHVRRSSRLAALGASWTVTARHADWRARTGARLSTSTAPRISTLSRCRERIRPNPAAARAPKPPMAPMALPMMLARTWFSSLPCGPFAAGPLPATG